MGVPVLWLCGPSGVGKSTVGWAIFDQLSRTGVRSAFLDLDQVGLCYPAPADDPTSLDEMYLRNPALLRLLLGLEDEAAPPPDGGNRPQVPRGSDPPGSDDSTSRGGLNALWLINAANGQKLKTISYGASSTFAQPVFADGYLFTASQGSLGLQAYTAGG